MADGCSCLWSVELSVDASAFALSPSTARTDGPDSQELLPSAKALRDDLVLTSSKSFGFYAELKSRRP